MNRQHPDINMICRHFLRRMGLFLTTYFFFAMTAHAIDNSKIEKELKTESIDGVQFEHGYVAVNGDGVQIHYLTAGDRRRPVLLIHGFPGSWRSWKPLMGRLVKQGYTVIVPDFRGAGESSAPSTGYDKKTMAQDMRALVSSLGFKEVAVVGHDIGLSIAYAYAAQFPDEVKKLVLMDAFFPGIAGWEQSYDGRPGKWHFRFFGDSPLQL